MKFVFNNLSVKTMDLRMKVSMVKLMYRLGSELGRLLINWM